MSNRRHVIMNLLANSFKWLPYSFEYLYHSLIPQKVNKTASLPNTYQEVEYIESSGTQRINTGFVANNNTRVILKYQSNPSVNTNLIWGSDGSSSGRFNLYYEANNNYKLGYGVQLETSTSIAPTSNKTICDWDKNVVKIGNDTYTFNSETFTISGTQLTLFSNSSWASQGNQSAWKLYSCQIYDNGTLVRNFIPCYRKSDNVIGLFDVVNQVFYTNVGTGTFTKGADVYRLVKNKARVNTIYGNSEVVNQQLSVNIPSWVSIGGLTITRNVANNTFTINGTTTAKTLNDSWGMGTAIAGHIYLYKLTLVSGSIDYSNRTTTSITNGYCLLPRIQDYAYSYQMPVSVGQSFSQIKTANSNEQFMASSFDENVVFTNATFQWQLIDLSQQYPFDTPTTLTDNRVQNIINRGYIAHNTGTIKNLDMGLISSEPYNLFDGEWELGGWTDSVVYNCKSKNFIKVVSGQTYDFDFKDSSVVGITASHGRYIREYDENYNVVKDTNNYDNLSTNFSITLTSQTRYVKIRLFIQGANFTNNFPTNVSFHRTGTRTGYAEHLNQLPADYQEVEYIESTGTQYIDTGFKPNQNTTFKLTFQLSSIEITQGIFGVGDSDLSKTYRLGVSSAGYFYFAKRGTQFNGASGTSNTNKNTFEFKNDKVYLNGNEYVSITDTTSYQCENNAYVFFFSGATTITKASGKLFELKLYDNGTLVRNFIPCYKKSTNEIGLFDLVQQKFYTNAGTGTFLKGANVNSVGSIPFKYQGGGVGTSHDKLQKTATEWVFTKDRYSYTFTGSETWLVEGAKYYCSLPIADAVNIKGGDTSTIWNVLCNNYMPQAQLPMTLGNVDNCVSVGSNPSTKVICVRDTTHITDTTTAQSYMTGKVVEYQLATPQITRIPIKHLGVYRITGNETISIVGSPISGKCFRLVLPSSAVDYKNSTDTLNIYCAKYLTIEGRFSVSVMHAGEVKQYGDNRSIDFCSNETTTDEFKANHIGDIIYYETQNEVADIPFEVDVEAGGSINASMFGWVENQLVSNGNFVDSSGWEVINATKSVSNNILTQTLTSIGSHKYGNGLYRNNFTTEINHKYLCIGNVKPKYNGNCYIGCGYTTNISGDISITANQWNKVVAIINKTSSSDYDRFTLAVDCTSNYQVGDTIDYKELECIDLTIGFGAGKEPTSVNDPIVQEIIRLGYIPTNTTGTYKEVDCEVLPDAEFNLKCK